MIVVLPNRGGVMSSGSVVQARSVADCDRWLAVLRVSVRRGPVESRELAWLTVDEVLDRRLELMEERARAGAQS